MAAQLRCSCCNALGHNAKTCAPNLVIPAPAGKTHECLRRREVIHINGTSGTKYANGQCICTTWIEHWRKNTGSDRKTCAFCNKEALPGFDLFGAHVMLKNACWGNDWYIVPVCGPKCNTPNGRLFLKENVALVAVVPWQKAKCRRRAV